MASGCHVCHCPMFLSHNILFGQSSLLPSIISCKNWYLWCALCNPGTQFFFTVPKSLQSLLIRMKTSFLPHSGCSWYLKKSELYRPDIFFFFFSLLSFVFGHRPRVVPFLLSILCYPELRPTSSLISSIQRLCGRPLLRLFLWVALGLNFPNG